MEKLTIDINCDLGEGCGDDERIMPFISSANIACGGHAGDRESMIQTIKLAARHDVAVGAHPSYPDRDGFGRNANSIVANDLHRSLVSQIAELVEIAASLGTRLRHVKPHGALYNQSAVQNELAVLIADAIASIDTSLIFVGMCSSEHAVAAGSKGLSFAGEAFADRNYDELTKLTPRDRDDALIADADMAASRCVDLVRYGRLRSTDGVMIAIAPDTICVHSDTPGAVEIARNVHTILNKAGVLIKSF